MSLFFAVFSTIECRLYEGTNDISVYPVDTQNQCLVHRKYFMRKVNVCFFHHSFHFRKEHKEDMFYLQAGTIPTT